MNNDFTNEHSVNIQRMLQIQGVPVKVSFSPSMSQGLNLIKYCSSMTLSLPRHGRFSYLTETFMKSQYDALQGHPKSEVKIKDMHNI